MLLELLLPGRFFGSSRQGEYEFTSEAWTDDTDIVRYPRRWIKSNLRSEATQGWVSARL